MTTCGFGIMLACLHIACFEPSQGQHWQNRPPLVYFSSENDSEIWDQNNYTSKTSLINPTVHYQPMQKQEKNNHADISTPTAYDIHSDQEQDKDHNKTFLPLDYSLNLRGQANQPMDKENNEQNTNDEIDSYFTTWNNTTNVESTVLNQNNSNEKNTTISDSYDYSFEGKPNITHNSSMINHTFSLDPLVGGQPVFTKNWQFGAGNSSSAGGERLTSVTAPLLQWHVGIYSKAFEPYMQICGGTLVTTKAVISAAHCFWSDLDGAMPANLFMAAAGKLYRPWNDPHDRYRQQSQISAVHIPTLFRGAITSFQDDIAAVLLTTPFEHSPAVRPLCVSFDEDLEHAQLREGNEGIVLGWGLTAADGPPAQALQYLYMPFVPTEKCVADSDASFLKYITSDKICAGVTTGKALCRGDSGGGLVFFGKSLSERVPLLLGVASTAPRNEHLCNTHARATLTRIHAHRIFLRTHIPDIEEACKENYVTFGKDAVEEALIDNKSAVTVPQNHMVQMHSGTNKQTKFICNCYCNDSTKY